MGMDVGAGGNVQPGAPVIMPTDVSVQFLPTTVSTQFQPTDVTQGGSNSGGSGGPV
jgi:hypothetical protein